MATKKLFVLLGRLSKKQVQVFDTYLRSGLEKAQPRDISAWDELYQQARSQRSLDAVTWEKAAAGLAPMDRRIRSSLIQYLQNFMVYLRFRSHTGLQHLLLLQEMNQEGTEKYVEGVFKKTAAQIGPQSIAALQLTHAVHDEMMAFDAKNPDRQPFENLPHTLQQFDGYYIAQKLKYSCALINQGRILSSQDDAQELPLLKAILLHLQHLEDAGEEATYDPLIWMYRAIYRMLTLEGPPAEAALAKLLELLEQNQSAYHPEELSDLYTFALNYCVRMINKKASREHVLICKSIYEHLLESRLIMDADGKFPIFHFKNIIVLMARQGEFEWVAQFIEKYAPLIAPEGYKVAHKFGLGLLAFFKGDYSTSFQYFDQVLAASGDIFLGLDARIYHLRTHYLRRDRDPGWADSLEHSIAAFRMALVRRSNKIAAFHKENYGNFARELNALARFSAQVPFPDLSTLQEAREELDSRDNVADKTWLLEQFDFLIKKAQG